MLHNGVHSPNEGCLDTSACGILSVRFQGCQARQCDRRSEWCGETELADTERTVVAFFETRIQMR